MEAEKLAAILTAHHLWRHTDGVEGTRANLYGAALSGANLSGADLSRAALSGANLSRAALSGADLSMANLSGANLSGANLSGADLSMADLSMADLSMADLYVCYFFQWQVVATSERMKIGCHDHDWADWKKHGAAYVKANGCEKEFKAWWPVADAARKWLVKRFPAKKPKPSGE